MRKSVVIVIALFALVAVVAVGCGSTPTASKAPTSTTGNDTSVKADAVTVQAIASKPESFDGAVVVTEGNYAVGYCSACFLLKDGVSSVRVEVSDTAPLPPESKLNSRMKVTGKIYVVKGSPNIIAEKIEYL